MTDEEDRCIRTDLESARRGVESGIIPKLEVPTKVEAVDTPEVKLIKRSEIKAVKT